MTNLQLITTPFAENGTKNIIPEGGAAEPQLATMQAGFPEITQRPIGGGGIPPERADFNGILNLYGQHLVHLNKGLPYEFDQDFANSIGGYPLNARIMLSSGEVVQNTQEGNTSNPNISMGGWKSSAVSKDVTVPTYKTAADGVNPVTGVADGSYYNVRSSDDDAMLVEYQNVGGSAVATGKSYPSAAYVQNVAKHTALPFIDGKTYGLNERVQLENGDIVRSTVDGNTANPNVDMTGWVNTSATIKTLDYFGGSIERASDWVKQSTSNFVEIPPKEFTLSRPIQYFNRFICRVGRAKINVPATTDLDYGYIEDGEVLHIDGIDFYVEGHRLGVTTNSYNRVFMTNYVNYPCISVHLKNINVYGMKDGAYVDDVGKTRCAGFIGFSVRVRQEIQHIRTFGLRIFCDAISSSPNATHDDFDVICVNAETGLYYQPSTWLAGSVKNIKLINTATEQTYFIGMNVGINNNGKDALMNAATYTVPLIVDDIYAKRAIERSIYIQSPNAQISNIVDEYSYSAGHTKINLVDAPIGRVKLSGITAKNPTNLGTVFQTYGLAELDVDNLDISFESNLSARAIVVANTGNFTLQDSKIKNVATAFWHTGGDGGPTKSINIHGLEAVNCVSSIVPFVYDRTSTGVLDKLSIKNSRFEISKDIVAIYVSAMDCTKVKSLDISESSFDISRSLFSYSATTTEIKLNDVVLNVRTVSAVSGIYADLLNPALAPVSANIFDITYNIDSRHATTLNVKTQIHCSKTTNTGIVRCLDYWDIVNIEIPVDANAPTAYYLMSFGAVSYFAEVSFAGSLLRYYYDATLNTITEQVNVGGKLATGAQNASKITLKVAQANNYRLDIDVGQTTWTGGGGTLKVKIYR